MATLGDRYVRGNNQDLIRQGISGLTIGGKISAQSKTGSEAIRISEYQPMQQAVSSKALLPSRKLLTINISNYQLQTPQPYQAGFIKFSKKQLYWLTDQKGQAELDIPDNKQNYKIHTPQLEIIK